MRTPRDYYQLLHVQPDAPSAVIKASYRTMMQKLRHHPDLGGDESNAKLLNEAMAVLGDPLSRARYDETLRAEPTTVAGAATGASESGTSAATGRTDDTATTRTESTAGDEAVVPSRGAPTLCPPTRCPFCGHVRPDGGSAAAAGYEVRDECGRCGGPTRPVERPDTSRIADLRQIHRLVYDGRATLWTSWPSSAPLSVTAIDLSITGCAVESTVPLRPESVVMIATAPLEAIGRVRSCRASTAANRHRSGIAFLTLRTLASPGALYLRTV